MWIPEDISAGLKSEKSVNACPVSIIARLSIPRANPIFVGCLGLRKIVNIPRLIHRRMLNAGSIVK
jgi:hypothetical protein